MVSVVSAWEIALKPELGMTDVARWFRQAARRPIACVAWSSAPRHFGSRDRYIGWSGEARRRNIRFIAYNTRNTGDALMYVASLFVTVCMAALVQPMPNPTGFLLSAFQTGQASGNRPSTSIFQIRLVRDHPSVDTNEMPWRSRDGQTMMLPVEKTPVFDISGVDSAAVVKDKATGQTQLSISLTQSGSKHFAEITKQNIHKRIAIIINGVLYVAPIIQAEISTDSLPIRGDFTEQQAKELARKINTAVKGTSPSRRE